MDMKEVGNTIKTKREAENITQEELCNGICTASTLSRIERGVISGNIDTLKLLLERLELPTEMLSKDVNEQDDAIRQVIREASQASVHGNQKQAWSLLESISEGYDHFSPTNKQRYDVLDTMLTYEDGVITNDERLVNMEKALRMTVPGYSIDNLPSFMTNMEAQILRYIANAYAVMENYSVAIKIYYQLKERENRKSDKIAASEKLVSICYNLSKCLGQVGRYDECIDVAKEGIRCCEYTRNISMLPNCMYNYAWSLVRRNMYGDKEDAKKLINEISKLCTPMTWDLDGLKEGIENIQKEFFN